MSSQQVGYLDMLRALEQRAACQQRDASVPITDPSWLKTSPCIPLSSDEWETLRRYSHYRRVLDGDFSLKDKTDVQHYDLELTPEETAALQKQLLLATMFWNGIVTHLDGSVRKFITTPETIDHWAEFYFEAETLAETFISGSAEVLNQVVRKGWLEQLFKCRALPKIILQRRLHDIVDAYAKAKSSCTLNELLSNDNVNMPRRKGYRSSQSLRFNNGEFTINEDRIEIVSHLPMTLKVKNEKASGQAELDRSCLLAGYDYTASITRRRIPRNQGEYDRMTRVSKGSSPFMLTLRGVPTNWY